MHFFNKALQDFNTKFPLLPPPPPPKELCPALVSLVFLYTFRPCRVLQETMQPGFQCSSVLQRKWRTHSEYVLCFLCFISNILHQGAGFEAWTSSPAGNRALTTGIHTITWQNNANSPQSCTVRPETSTEQSSLRGIYVVQDLNAGR
jgi:hypothetical protein